MDRLDVDGEVLMVREESMDLIRAEPPSVCFLQHRLYIQICNTRRNTQKVKVMLIKKTKKNKKELSRYEKSPDEQIVFFYQKLYPILKNVGEL